jgi:Ca2+-binding EF-hand superfamily protein
MNIAQTGTSIPHTNITTTPTIQKYEIARSSIKNSRDIFDRYATEKHDKMPMTNLKAALGDVFYRENAFRPTESDFNLLFKKYDYKNDHKVSFREFKRMLKHLGGHKVYDSNTIGMDKTPNIDNYSTNSNVKAVPISQAKLAPVSGLNLQSNTPQSQQQGYQSTPFERKHENVYQQGIEQVLTKETTVIEKIQPVVVSQQVPQIPQTPQIQTFPLMLRSIKSSKVVFKNYDKNNNGTIQMADIPLAVN